MSRTDRDAPSWLRATWWTPLHRCATLYTTEYPGRARLTRRLSKATPRAGTRLRRFLAPLSAECDLPPAPDLRQYLADSTHCAWRPLVPLQLQRRLYGGGPTRSFVQTTWTRPQRARVRDQCHLAVQEHRATGTADIMPTTDDHRHNAR